MLSIRSKRNTPKRHDADHEKQLELIKGSLELIDLLYQYIYNDGVGLTYVKSSIVAGKKREVLFQDFSTFFDNIEMTIAALTNTTIELQNVIYSQSEHYNKVVHRLEDCHQYNDDITASLTRMHGLIEEGRSLAEGRDSELSSVFQRLLTEVSLVESREHDKSQLILQVFTEYQEKVNEFKASIGELLTQMKQDIEILKQKDDFQGTFASVKAINAKNIAILDKRERENVVMLNDLISFILQLKSILISLQQECSK